jgi:hypothetical protein
MPGEDFDPPSVTVSIEADFGAGDPAPPLEALFPRGLQSGVALIEQSVQLGALPAGHEV